MAEIDEEAEYNAFHAGATAALESANDDIKETDGFLVSMSDHTIKEGYRSWVRRGRT